MIMYKKFLSESEEYKKILEIYNTPTIDYVADMYLKENDEEYSNRRKLEYPYSTLATMNVWLGNH